ncbi:hypothetical protein [Actinosynnema sp. ALI-1.44]|uniref:hypothetical protein n=1 Tax=Actinosynnema sp. ALI-1.44 TaxID=1933779 RepID=UPI00117865CD|nr:hypothetical protein [Actinosynnema sp. ALI-1.44]
MACVVEAGVAALTCLAAVEVAVQLTCPAKVVPRAPLVRLAAEVAAAVEAVLTRLAVEVAGVALRGRLAVVAGEAAPPACRAEEVGAVPLRPSTEEPSGKVGRAARLAPLPARPAPRSADRPRCPRRPAASG